MSASVIYPGKKYRLILEDLETGNRAVDLEADYWSVETDATDFWFVLSMCPAAEREDIRRRAGEASTLSS